MQSNDSGNDKLKNDTNGIIRFSAQVSKVTTLADGGLRIVLDLAETEIEVAKQMMQAKQAGAVLEIAAVPTVASGGWDNVSA